MPIQLRIDSLTWGLYHPTMPERPLRGLEGCSCHLSSNPTRSGTTSNSNGCSASLAHSRPPNGHTQPGPVGHGAARNFRVPKIANSLGARARRHSMVRRKKSNPSCSLLNSRPTERGRLDLFSGTVGSSPNSLLTCVNCFWNLAAISFREPNFSVLFGPFPCVPEQNFTYRCPAFLQ